MLGKLFGKKEDKQPKPYEFDGSETVFYGIARNFEKNIKHPIDTSYFDHRKHREMSEARIAYAKEHYPDVANMSDPISYSNPAPCNPDLFIQEMHLKKTARKKLPEWTYGPDFLIVSPRIKKILEKHESKRIQYIPYKIITHEKVEHEYFAANFLGRIDCMDYETSQYQKTQRVDGSTSWADTGEYEHKFFNKSCIGDRHIFNNANAGRAFIFISEQLSKELGDFLTPDLSLYKYYAI